MCVCIHTWQITILLLLFKSQPLLSTTTTTCTVYTHLHAYIIMWTVVLSGAQRTPLLPNSIVIHRYLPFLSHYHPKLLLLLLLATYIIASAMQQWVEAGRQAVSQPSRSVYSYSPSGVLSIYRLSYSIVLHTTYYISLHHHQSLSTDDSKNIPSMQIVDSISPNTVSAPPPPPSSTFL